MLICDGISTFDWYSERLVLVYDFNIINLNHIAKEGEKVSEPDHWRRYLSDCVVSIAFASGQG